MALGELWLIPLLMLTVLTFALVSTGQRGIDYFVGSLFSIQFIFAYGAGAAVTTAIQYILFIQEILILESNSLSNLPVILALYAESFLPIWIGGLTEWNIWVVAVNAVIGLWIMMMWTYRFVTA